VDAGCGTGGLLAALHERGYRNLFGCDVSPTAIAISEQRGLRVQQCDLIRVDRLPFPGCADAIVSNDTLYFFTREEQQRILRMFACHLAPGGLLIMNVPALRSFRGSHDLAVGIRHRFSRAEVRFLLHSAGFAPLSVRFWPFLLSPLIYLRRLGQRLQLRQGAPTAVRSDIDLPSLAMNGILEKITRLENALLPWKPFGSSLFAVATKAP
jgi:SAM-dependent methyltransferase